MTQQSSTIQIELFNQLSQLLENQKHLNNRLTKLEKTIVAKDEQIKQLHTLANAMAKDVFKKYAEPLIFDLINYIHQVERQLDFLEKNDENANSALTKHLIQTKADLSQMLKRMNVVSYKSHPKSHFKPSLHQPIEIVHTTKKELDNKICKTVKTGFYWDEKVKWREQVFIYKYQH